ncbi:MAG: hypothetical protein HFJ09_16515 [Lachnospiraceae bacterium]|nr:hypothetical protein [Lachnospiraceae bacterium]
MTATSEASGYKWKATIDLGSKSGTQVCFNDGNNNWDSQNGANYTVSTGTCGIKGGKQEVINIVDSTPNIEKISVTIYYSNDSYKNAFIHYKVGDGNWTNVPGMKMIRTDDRDGYTWKYMIDVEDKNPQITVCFNDGLGNWDSKNGENYLITSSVAGVKNGKVDTVMSELEPKDSSLLETGRNTKITHEGDLVIEETEIYYTKMETTKNNSVYPLSDTQIDASKKDYKTDYMLKIHGVSAGGKQILRLDQYAEFKFNGTYVYVNDKESVWYCYGDTKFTNVVSSYTKNKSKTKATYSVAGDLKWRKNSKSKYKKEHWTFKLMCTPSGKMSSSGVKS